MPFTHIHLLLNILPHLFYHLCVLMHAHSPSVFTHVCVYVFTYLHAHVFIYIHAHIYKHTYTHIFSLNRMRVNYIRHGPLSLHKSVRIPSDQRYSLISLYYNYKLQLTLINLTQYPLRHFFPLQYKIQSRVRYCVYLSCLYPLLV